MYKPSKEKVLAAAGFIVDAFARTDGKAYFRCFSPDASFVFHSEKHRLDSRGQYEALWSDWLRQHWRVIECESTDRHVQSFPGGAVFSHTVQTSVTSDSGPDGYTERETIVFQALEDQSLVAIHEHLSPVLVAGDSDEEITA